MQPVGLVRIRPEGAAEAARRTLEMTERGGKGAGSLLEVGADAIVDDVGGGHEVMRVLAPVIDEAGKPVQIEIDDVVVALQEQGIGEIRQSLRVILIGLVVRHLLARIADIAADGLADMAEFENGTPAAADHDIGTRGQRNVRPAPEHHAVHHHFRRSAFVHRQDELVDPARDRTLGVSRAQLSAASLRSASASFSRAILRMTDC